MRYFFRVEYDGAGYAGWQVQNDAVSIQSTLNNAFSTVTRTECSVFGAGRTDAGVHARGQGAHVDLAGDIDVYRLRRAVNGVLPKDIAVYDFRAVPDEFNARYSAVHRTYKYYLAGRKSPLHRTRAWWPGRRIEWERVRDALPALMGTHDFTAFCATGHSAKTMQCTVHLAELERHGDLVVFTIRANRFLYKMVRSIVGTLVGLGCGKIQSPLEEILRLQNRSLVGETAPPHGLVLEYVAYNEV